MTDPNPYASPAIPDPPLPFAEAGVGVWRDGNLLVIHRDAPLPPICIRSGQPADEVCPLKIKWNYGWVHYGRRMTMHVPLSRHWVFWHRRGSWILFIVAAILGLAAAVVVPFRNGLGEDAWMILLFALGTTASLCVLIGLSFRRLLEFVRVRGDFFWFTGAHRKFLDQLPEWHFGK